MLMTALLTNYDPNWQRLLPKWTCNLAVSLILSRTLEPLTAWIDDQSLLPCAEQHELRLQCLTIRGYARMVWCGAEPAINNTRNSIEKMLMVQVEEMLRIQSSVQIADFEPHDLALALVLGTSAGLVYTQFTLNPGFTFTAMISSSQSHFILTAFRLSGLLCPFISACEKRPNTAAYIAVLNWGRSLVNQTQQKLPM